MLGLGIAKMVLETSACRLIRTGTLLNNRCKGDEKDGRALLINIQVNTNKRAVACCISLTDEAQPSIGGLRSCCSSQLTVTLGRSGSLTLQLYKIRHSKSLTHSVIGPSLFYSCTVEMHNV